MNLETTRAALSLLEQGVDYAWATIVGTSGSSPRHSGAAMVVQADGSAIGTIGGGPLEATVIRLAVEAVRNRRSCTKRFESAQLGMRCGGSELVLVEYVDSGQAAPRKLLQSIVELLEQGRSGWLVTETTGAESDETLVRRGLIASNGSVTGDAPCDLPALRKLAGSGVVGDTTASDGLTRRYVERVGARGTAYVFGAGHCGHRLVPLLGSVDFFTVVVDDRPDFANTERFPAADRIVVPRSFEEAVSDLSIGEDGYIVVVTRGHTHDKCVLAQALRTEACYIGMIGSRTKVADTFHVLREEGFSEDDLARVHAPIGLPIGAETPEEIAVSIAAQLIQTRASRESRSLT
jgi:xanthine dehydrogenase accessory factor